MIIGYIHICQKGEWVRSIDMLLNAIKRSGLYDATSRIRLSILNDSGIVDDIRFQDDKMEVVYRGISTEYERPTLLHMREMSYEDPPQTNYWYCHTKGLRWFGTPNEKCITDWINLLIYWNLEKWENAIDKLATFDTYGCNYYEQDTKFPSHYSGNFYWATRKYIQTLPSVIGHKYNDPEYWVCSNNPTFFNVYSSGYEGMGHYSNEYDPSKYQSEKKLFDQVACRKFEEDIIQEQLHYRFIPKPDKAEERRQQRIQERIAQRKQERSQQIYSPEEKERIKAIRMYCVYFPQFHACIENDTNFYPGFTDIVNLDLLTKEKPSNYLTPSLKELGLNQTTDYDLVKNKGLIQRQIDILADYNIEGFAMYYYWFTVNTIGKTNMLMKDVVDRFFDGSVHMKGRKLYFIWANENWTSNAWLGPTNRKIENVYDEPSIMDNVNNLLKYFKHEHYLKIDNKPVLFLYHPWFMTEPQIHLFFKCIHEACIEQGFAGIHLILNGLKKTISGFTHFHSMANLYQFYYSDFSQKVKNHTFKDRIQSINFDFDNEPRIYKPYRDAQRKYLNVNEESQEKILKKAIHHYAKTPSVSSVDNLLLINAWNEWGERMAVEPSEQKGYYFLDMLKNLIPKKI